MWDASQALTVLGWALSPVCASLVTYAVAQRRAARAADGEKAARDRALADGMRVLLRNELVELHRRHVASGAACPVTVKEQATEVYEAYHALGGNGTGTRLYEEIMGAHVERRAEGGSAWASTGR